MGGGGWGREGNTPFHVFFQLNYDQAAKLRWKERFKSVKLLSLRVSYCKLTKMELHKVERVQTFLWLGADTSAVTRSRFFAGNTFLLDVLWRWSSQQECALLWEKMPAKFQFAFHYKPTGKKYPFFATQWHPEKIQFEWEPKAAIDHSPDAIRVGQYMANFFVNQGINSDTFSTSLRSVFVGSRLSENFSRPCPSN